jgi:hypothetical protein
MEQRPRERRENERNEQVEAAGPRVQRFHFGPWIFRVDKAQAMLAEARRETSPLPVGQWARFYGLDSTDDLAFSILSPRQDLDRNYAMTTDLRDPVVVATLRTLEGSEFPLLIDGTHRLYHAYMEGVPSLEAYVLNVEESLAIREEAYYR